MEEVIERKNDCHQGETVNTKKYWRLLQGERILKNIFSKPGRKEKWMTLAVGGAIFVRKIGRTANPGINEIPKSLQHRLLSLRGYNKDGMMKAATVTEGKNLKEQIFLMFKNDKIRYIHIHNAKQGCYQAMVERV